MKINKQSKNNGQLIWGGALILMGVALFLRVPQVIPKLAEMGQSTTTIVFFRVCIYLIGIILIGGGIKKVAHHLRPNENKTVHNTNDNNDV